MNTNLERDKRFEEMIGRPIITADQMCCEILSDQ